VLVDQPADFWNRVIGELKQLHAICFESEQGLFTSA
jgi:hypothetical protein